MRYNSKVQILFLAFSIITFSFSKYCYSRDNGDFIKRNRKCIKKCTRQANLLLRIKCYDKFIERSPENPDLYILRAKVYLKIKEYNSAISDFIKVVELEPGNTEAYYAIAGTASLARKKEYALLWLKRALEAGFNDFQRITTDSSLDNIRNTKEFKELLKKLNYELSFIK